jgi:hypothetical protein
LTIGVFQAYDPLNFEQGLLELPENRGRPTPHRPCPERPRTTIQRKKNWLIDVLAFLDEPFLLTREDLSRDDLTKVLGLQELSTWQSPSAICTSRTWKSGSPFPHSVALVTVYS